jgi:hypothetical protein
VQFVKFGDTPWFQHEGVELREVKLVGWKPQGDAAEQQQVIYKGPFRQAADDRGTIYPRGQAVTVSAAVCDLLRQSSVAEQFFFPEPGTTAACSPCA